MYAAFSHFLFAQRVRKSFNQTLNCTTGKCNVTRQLSILNLHATKNDGDSCLQKVIQNFHMNVVSNVGISDDFVKYLIVFPINIMSAMSSRHSDGT
jgi:hypothetical protein